MLERHDLDPLKRGLTGQGAENRAQTKDTIDRKNTMGMAQNTRSACVRAQDRRNTRPASLDGFMS